MTNLRTIRKLNPHAIAEVLMARGFALVVALYGLGVLIAGRYHSRGQVVEDPARVWLTGGLMLAAGAYLATLRLRDRPAG